MQRTAICRCSFVIGSGTAYVDDADLERTSNLNAANTSVYRDEVVASLSAIHPGSLRLWDYSWEKLSRTGRIRYSEDISSLRLKVRLMSLRPRGGTRAPQQGLMDFLGLCEVMGVKAWITIPVSWPASDYSNLIDFLAGGAGTTYGAKRIANGHPATYIRPSGTSISSSEMSRGTLCSLELTCRISPTPPPVTECCITGTGPVSAMSAMKANSNFSGAIQLIVNMQAASDWRFTAQVSPNNPYLDAVSIAPYIGGGQFDSASTLTAEWNPDTAFAWGDSNDTSGDQATDGLTLTFMLRLLLCISMKTTKIRSAAAPRNCRTTIPRSWLAL